MVVVDPEPSPEVAHIAVLRTASRVSIEHHTRTTAHAHAARVCDGAEGKWLGWVAAYRAVEDALAGRVVPEVAHAAVVEGQVLPLTHGRQARRTLGLYRSAHHTILSTNAHVRAHNTLA